jgi:energy-converting hydrogenase Eha subunit H
MLSIVGVLLVIAGLVFVTLAILAWLGVVSPVKRLERTEANWPDVLVAVLKTVPWVALVGLALIYVGLRTLGVDLSIP